MQVKDIVKVSDGQLIQGDDTTEITGIKIDSREIEPGDLFVCIKGALADGHSYIQKAIENGAAGLLVEDTDNITDSIIPVIQIEDTHEQLGPVAAAFYDNPAEELTIIGITGTKGKTTVTSLLQDILTEAGLNCASIGTRGIKYADVDYKGHNTTPDGLVLQRTFRDMIDKGVTHVVMEASSQSFKLKRTNGFLFDIGIFLNIDRDHIGENEHKDFEEYLNCKRQIFPNSKKVIVNKSDKIWNMLSDEERDQAITISNQEPADYWAHDLVPFISDSTFGTRFQLDGKVKTPVETSLPLDYNVTNVLSALAVTDMLGVELNSVLDSIAHFKSPGRTELLPNARKYNRTVFVDFAHNKLSIESVLKGMRVYNPKRLLSMFGLHWDETKMRRYDQGYAAGKYSDYTVLTSDHKGPISFEEINKDTIRALEETGANYSVIKSRKEAIEHLMEIADEEDIVVLFGMGDERVQHIDGVDVYFNEGEIVEDYLKEHIKI